MRAITTVSLTLTISMKGQKWNPSWELSPMPNLYGVIHKHGCFTSWTSELENEITKKLPHELHRLADAELGVARAYKSLLNELEKMQMRKIKNFLVKIEEVHFNSLYQ